MAAGLRNATGAPATKEERLGKSYAEGGNTATTSGQSKQRSR